MTILLPTPLSPFGRLVRLALAEDGRPATLTDQPPSDEFLLFGLEEAEPVSELWDESPIVAPFGAAMGPVLLVEDTSLSGALGICEYFEETRAEGTGRPLLPGTPIERAESRRLAAWAGDAFWREAVEPALSERYLKSVFGGGAPNSVRLRVAAEAARGLLQVAGAQIEARGWLAGESLSLADFALAAQISVLDYLGDWPFGDGEDPARDWYALVKSRPAFRGILADRVPRLPPSATYQDLDF